MFKKRISLPLFFLVCVVLVVVTFQATFIGVTELYRGKIAEENSDNTKSDWQSKLEYIDKLTQMYFLKDIPLEELEDKLPAVYVSALADKYTYYMTKEEYDALNENLNGEMQGIGVSVIYNSERSAIEVIGVMNASPALEGGVKIGDLIYKVEGQLVEEIGYNEAMNVMLGKAGSVASFSVMRKEGDQELSLDFSITRGFIVQETVSYRLHGKNVGIIRIEEFDKETPKQFKNAIDDLLKQGADRFVFDMRYNPGGELSSVSEILDMLLPKGKIIRMIDKYGEETSIESDEKSLDYPMAVLTNGSTASAAELFTSALKDYDKAVVVGEKTFGKGTMQSVIELPDGSAVYMTTRYYLPPMSESYNEIGIKPDIEVSIPSEYENISIYKLEYEQDTQLKTAVEELSK